MTTTEMQLSDKQHEQCARALFNYAWTFLARPALTPEETDLMIHASHASWLHWSKVGTAANMARADWQLSRVYATAGLGERSVHYARRCLATCRANDLAGFDLAFAYEALARGHAVSGDSTRRLEYLALARDAAQGIDDEEDRAMLMADLETV